MAGLFIEKYEMIADLKIEPESINIKSKGNWVTCYIKLPMGFKVTDIDKKTISITRINGNILEFPIFPIERPWETQDSDNDGIPDRLMVKFSRSSIASVISGTSATLIIEFELINGIKFWGHSTVKIINN